MTPVSKYKVVITDYYNEVMDLEKDILSEVGAGIIAGRYRSTADVVSKARDADVLLVDQLQITSEVFDKLTKLKAVVRYGIGFDNVDVKAATAKGVKVVNIPDAMTMEVAEHALALLLGIVRKIHIADRLVRSGKWADPSAWAGPVPKIRGKTVGILGLGRVGRTVADILKCFKVTIVGYDPYLKPEVIKSMGVHVARDLEEFLKLSDFVMVHIPLTDETRHLMGEKALRSMKKNAFLVNCARGAIIDPRALHRALTEGWIAGAGLDVFEREPVDRDDPLLKLDNLIATPHMAFYSDIIHKELRRQAVEETVRILKGENPLNLVNPEVACNCA
jgi:D-3-phosphoglycerate dehydrogenase